MLNKKITTITETYNENGVLIGKSTEIQEFEFDGYVKECEGITVTTKPYFDIPLVSCEKKEKDAKVNYGIGGFGSFPPWVNVKE